MPGLPTIEPYSMLSRHEIPQPVAPWHIDAGRVVLLVHDMQRYFLRPMPPDGPRSALIENVHVLIQRCRARSVPIAFTVQRGGMTPKERGLLKIFWGEGMQLSAEDKSLVEPLTMEPSDWCITKWRYSAFHKTDLLERMTTIGRDQLIVCGVYAHIGILMTAIDAFSHDIENFIVADAVADFSMERHLMALDYAAERCAVVVTAEEVLV